MTYHPVVNKIINILKTNNVWFETFEHEEVTTSKEASKVRSGYTLSQGAKAMIVRVKETNGNNYFLMLVLPGDKRINFEKVKLILQAKDIRLANPDEINKITDGVKIGGIPPFGNLFGLKIIVDVMIFEKEKIIFNAGDRAFSIAVNSRDYKNILNPDTQEISL